MIAAIVVPWSSLSKASTASCLVPLTVEAQGMRSGFADLFATLLARAILIFEEWRILFVVTALSAVTTETPQSRLRQRGRIPGKPKSAPLSARRQ
jgi:hypothetical protein